MRWLRNGMVGALLGCAACGGAVHSEETTPRVDEDALPPPRAVATLRLTGAQSEEMPRSRVELVVLQDAGQRHVEEVGVVSGICRDLRHGEGLQEVRCWWAGDERRLVLLRAGHVLRVVEYILGEPHERMRYELPPRTVVEGL